MNKKFNDILACVPLDGDFRIDWDRLGDTALSPVFSKMEKTEQDPRHHAEGNVLNHTKAVCEALVSCDEYRVLDDSDKKLTFVSALLHDIGKIRCTRVEDGAIVSPHHCSVGAVMAREFLWRQLGLCGDRDAQSFRESVCSLIRYHSFPPHANDDNRGERYYHRMASVGELATGFSLRKLCLLEKADILGRISGNGDEWLETVEFCLMQAEEYGCADSPFVFPSDFTKRAYFKKKTDWKEQEMYDDTWGEVILMSGLPGTGKDTWISENCGDLPMISLDDIRNRLGILPTDNQGEVISAAKAQAREYLRKKQPFVWNATNITDQMRGTQIQLFEDYGASVRTVYLETEWNEQMRRNSERKAYVPQAVIEGMLSKTVLPEPHECAKVEWYIVKKKRGSRYVYGKNT